MIIKFTKKSRIVCHLMSDRVSQAADHSFVSEKRLCAQKRTWYTLTDCYSQIIIGGKIKYGSYSKSYVECRDSVLDGANEWWILNSIAWNEAWICVQKLVVNSGALAYLKQTQLLKMVLSGLAMLIFSPQFRLNVVQFESAIRFVMSLSYPEARMPYDKCFEN